MERYRQAVASGAIAADPAQVEAMLKLDRLYDALLQRLAEPGWLARTLRRWRKPVAPLRGLYIWGGVGRGKTMLMDWFFASLPPGLGIRVHFHRFMHRVHRDLERHKGVANPLHRVADDFAAKGQVLCFDEFFVSDIGDAMLLGELLKALFSRGVVLVATSNVEPARLYENGLQRSRFLPAIDYVFCRRPNSIIAHWIRPPSNPCSGVFWHWRRMNPGTRCRWSSKRERSSLAGSRTMWCGLTSRRSVRGREVRMTT
jgi:cell division protein ZapE